MFKISTPLNKKQIFRLKPGDEVALTGVIYTARDQAHKRLVEVLAERKKLPIELKGAIIYYCGPTKTPPGKVIGSCGPTTSARMDDFTPALLRAGLGGMIGKGKRADEVVRAIKQYKAVYFLTYAGCGALLAQFVASVRPAAYAELGPEAIYRLEVRDFPLIVGVDCQGKTIWK